MEFPTPKFQLEAGICSEVIVLAADVLGVPWAEKDNWGLWICRQYCALNSLHSRVHCGQQVKPLAQEGPLWAASEATCTGGSIVGS